MEQFKEMVNEENWRVVELPKSAIGLCFAFAEANSEGLRQQYRTEEERVEMNAMGKFGELAFAVFCQANGIRARTDFRFHDGCDIADVFIADPDNPEDKGASLPLDMDIKTVKHGANLLILQSQAPIKKFYALVITPVDWKETAAAFVYGWVPFKHLEKRSEWLEVGDKLPGTDTPSRFQCRALKKGEMFGEDSDIKDLINRITGGEMRTEENG